MHAMEAVERALTLKMIWSSALWLVSAANGGAPIGEVHGKHEASLRCVVEELYRECGDIHELVEFEQALAYLRSYSLSMPSVVSSKELALE